MDTTKIKAVADSSSLEINGEWLECLAREHVSLTTCPTNERVAEIITKHLQEEL